MNKKEIKRWDDHLFEQRKELGIEDFHGTKKDRGTIRIERDISRCTICGVETHYILFLNKHNQGTEICVCKDCLKETIKMLEG